MLLNPKNNTIHIMLHSDKGDLTCAVIFINFVMRTISFSPLVNIWLALACGCIIDFYMDINNNFPPIWRMRHGEPFDTRGSFR